MLVGLTLLAVLGWSSTRFTRISVCTSCHEIFVDFDKYKPEEKQSASVEDYLPAKPFKASLFTSTVGCAECHAYPYEEYRESAHHQNERDIQAGCMDCHSAHSVWDILSWKFFYINTGKMGESPFHAISSGLRDIPEWEALRVILAKRVRIDMVKEDSVKCKNCHKPESKWFNKIIMHQNNPDNKTCVQCHYNITHKDVPWHKE